MSIYFQLNLKDFKKLRGYLIDNQENSLFLGNNGEMALKGGKEFFIYRKMGVILQREKDFEDRYGLEIASKLPPEKINKKISKLEKKSGANIFESKL